MMLGKAHGELGDMELQRASLERAVCSMERAYGAEHVQTAIARFYFACAVRAQLEAVEVVLRVR